MLFPSMFYFLVGILCVFATWCSPLRLRYKDWQDADKECPRLNQKNWKPKLIPFAKARNRIETLCSQLTEQFLVIRQLCENNKWSVCPNNREN